MADSQDVINRHHEEKILVTGHLGFIGGSLVSKLREQGHQVVGLDEADGSPVDLRHAEAVHACIARERPGLIFHLGGVSGPMQFSDDEAAVLRINGEGTLNILRSAVACGVKRVVNASSVAGYVHASHFGAEPDSVYGATKRLGEMLTGIYRRKGLLQATSVRIGSVYGVNRMTENPMHGMVIDALNHGRVTYDEMRMEPCIEVRTCVAMLAALVPLDEFQESYDLMTDRPLASEVAGMICELTGATSICRAHATAHDALYPVAFDAAPLLTLIEPHDRISLSAGMADLVADLAAQLGKTVGVDEGKNMGVLGNA